MIIAANKMDLVLSNNNSYPDEQTQARSRQQIVSLLQRFKFVRQCIKTSAKTLVNVNDIFVKAQHAVFYPINPLYNLSTGKLTQEFKQALARIFRIFDQDNDGLLSSSELNTFQSYCFHLSKLMEGGLAGWKKVIPKNEPSEPVIRDGKFTISGFFNIFDVFINSDRLEIPWTVLRIFGYDDELNLKIPSEVENPTTSTSKLPFDLSVLSTRFLTDLFYQFSSNKEYLSESELSTIFSIIPTAFLPPWHPSRVEDLFYGCFSVPKISTDSKAKIAESAQLPTESAADHTITKDSPLLLSPSTRVSLQEWISQWCMVCAISSSVARSELYRLGHVEYSCHHKLGKRLCQPAISPSVKQRNHSDAICSTCIRVMIIGYESCEKSAFLEALCQHEKECDSEAREHSKTYCTNVQMKKKTKNPKITKSDVTTIIFTDIPKKVVDSSKDEFAEVFSENKSIQGQGFDLVLFMIDCSNPSSLDYAIMIEEHILPEDVPRIFVCTKHDKMKEQISCGEMHDEVLTKTKQHCAKLDIEPPLLTSFVSGCEDKQRQKTLEHIVYSTLDPCDVSALNSRPFERRKRIESARRTKMLWLGGFLGLAVSFAAVTSALRGSSKEAKNDGNEKKSWLKSILKIGKICNPISYFTW